MASSSTKTTAQSPRTATPSSSSSSSRLQQRSCNFHRFFLTFLLLSAQCEFSAAHMNLAVSPEDVQRLLGVNADVFYVREGEVNAYALRYVIPVGANVDHINFTWQSLHEYTLPYSITIVSTNHEVLPPPTLNIPPIGHIPTYKQTFTLGLRCSGSADAEIEIMIVIDVIMEPHTPSKNVTRLTIRRKKFCLEGDQNFSNWNEPMHGPPMDELVHELMNEPASEHVNDAEHERPVEVAASVNNSLFTLIVGGTLAFILISVVVILAMWCFGGAQRRKHTRETNAGHMVSTASFQHLNLNNPNGTMAMGATIPLSLYSASTWPAGTMSSIPRKVNTCNSDYELPKPLSTEELQQRISELTVERCRVRLSCLLHEGSFGRVYSGTYNDTQDVIVKTVDQRSSQMQTMLFLQEGMLLYSAKHPSVLSVMGISIEDHAPPFVLYPAEKNMRNLKNYLREIGHPITSKEVVKIALQLSLALEHLHSHDVVHRDIAARNCVIDDRYQVKLTDNALSHDLFAEDYYCLDDGENRPVKWLSLEALESWQYSEASDSWAFAVLLWEICTLAKQPYAEIDHYQMLRYLKEGYRLAQPYNCPDELFAIMAYCWALSPEDRPSFSQLHVCLDEFYAQLTRYI